MTAIPVITDVPVTYWPVTADADEYVLAKIIRINRPVCEIRSPIVVNNIIVSGPDNPVAYPMMIVPVNMLMAIYVFYYLCMFQVWSVRRPFSFISMSAGCVPVE